MTDIAAPAAAANPLAWADSGFVVAPPAVAPQARSSAPDAAVRARINAIIIDGIILIPILGGLAASAGTTAHSATTLLFALGLQFVYFFGLEAKTGQTIGKRICHVRVVGIDGAPITVRQAAIRNVLRFIDALPMLYASGLLTMMRTGAAKRQRIGDVVAATVVIVEPGGRPLPTPRALLPIATLIVTALSIGVIVVDYNAIETARAASAGATAGADARSVPLPVGFAGGSRQAPAAGGWSAIGTVTSSAGYGTDPLGVPFARAWRIARSCAAAGCSYVLTRQVAGGPALRARLTRAADGWRGFFPASLYTCGQTSAGAPIYWAQQSAIVVTFTDGGRTAQANQRDFSYNPACGFGTHTIAWTAHRG